VNRNSVEGERRHSLLTGFEEAEVVVANSSSTSSSSCSSSGSTDKKLSS